MQPFTQRCLFHTSTASSPGLSLGSPRSSVASGAGLEPGAPRRRALVQDLRNGHRGGVRNMPERKSRRTDVLIVGSGAVGVAAGLEAHEAGAQVVVIEKEAHLGGAAAISGGGCSCVGTRLQREHGIEDSPDLAFDDWITWGEGAADEAWARFYIEHSNADLYQWGIERGVQWDGLNQQEGNSVPRWHRPTGGGGG